MQKKNVQSSLVHEVRDSNSLNPLFVRKSPGKFNSLTMWRTYPANLIMLAAAHSNKSREQCASVQSKNPVLYSFYVPFLFSTYV